MLRERVTVTLQPELIQAVDLLVDRQTLRNRSHAFEHLLKEGLGLHELQHAFLFFAEGWTQAQLEAVLTLCADIGVRTLLLCLPTAQVADALAILANHPSAAQVTSQTVPPDFGSGGALLLQRVSLTHPFLLFWLGPELALPSNLIQPYTFHRQHHAVLTRVIHSADGHTYRASGVDIAQPELLDAIPAGIVSLEAVVFPQLIRDARIRGYATATTTF